MKSEGTGSEHVQTYLMKFGGSIGRMEGKNDREVVSSNPCTAYQMDRFSHLFDVKSVLLFEEIENKWKRGRDWNKMLHLFYPQIFESTTILINYICRVRIP